jgi:RNA polymerase sigma factor (TIGR02999 family)
VLRVMRTILLDHARSRGRGSRRPSGSRVPLDGLANELERRSADLVDLDAALEALADLGGAGTRSCRIVELRFFAGLSFDEIAEVTGRSRRTVFRDWKFGRTWLHARLAGRPDTRSGVESPK